MILGHIDIHFCLQSDQVFLLINFIQGYPHFPHFRLGHPHLQVNELIQAWMTACKVYSDIIDINCSDSNYCCLVTIQSLLSSCLLCIALSILEGEFMKSLTFTISLVPSCSVAINDFKRNFIAYRFSAANDGFGIDRQVLKVEDSANTSPSWFAARNLLGMASSVDFCNGVDSNYKRKVGRVDIYIVNWLIVLR